MDSNPQKFICRVCKCKHAQYVCPRCNVRTCSLQCYKQHSGRCTETFYRQEATEVLKTTRASDEDKLNMLKVLKRNADMINKDLDWEHGVDASSQYDEGGEEEEEQLSIPGLAEETVKRLIAKAEAEGDDFEISDDDLTADEISQFEAAVATGKLSHVVESCTPWWETDAAAELKLGMDGCPLVAPMMPEPCSISGEETSSDVQLPEGLSQPLPPLSSLTRAQPSPLLRWQLLEVVYAYCFMMRMYNGRWQDDPVGASELLLALAPCLCPPVQTLNSKQRVSTCKARKGVGVHAKQGPVQTHTLNADQEVPMPSGVHGLGSRELGEGVGGTDRGRDNTMEQCSLELSECLRPSSGIEVDAKSMKKTTDNALANVPESTGQESRSAREVGNSSECSFSLSKERINAECDFGTEPANVPDSAGREPGTSQSAWDVAVLCIERACQPPVGSHSTRTVAIKIWEDVSHILQLGRSVLLLAVIDVNHMLSAALNDIARADVGHAAKGADILPAMSGLFVDKVGRLGKSSEQKQQSKAVSVLKRASLKSAFMCSWVNELDEEVIVMLNVELVACIAQLQSTVLLDQPGRYQLGLRSNQRTHQTRGPQAKLIEPL